MKPRRNLTVHLGVHLPHAPSFGLGNSVDLLEVEVSKIESDESKTELLDGVL